MSANYDLISHSVTDHIHEQSFFFHHDKFVCRNDVDNTICFSYLKQQTAIAKIYFSIEGDKAISLSKSPFGSADFAISISDKEIEDFLEGTLDELVKTNAHTVQIIGFPTCYHIKNQERLDSALLKTGFSVAYDDTTFYLDLTNDFVRKIKRSEKRYINHAVKNSYRFETLPAKYLAECYELIRTSRKNKGYPITMSLKEVEQAIGTFPGYYQLYGLFDRDVLIATSLCIRVNDHILYNFYNGDHPEYRKHSPLVPLFYHLTHYARSEGYLTLDLGVATEKGKINPGLYNFKTNIGGIACKKRVYTMGLRAF